MSSLEREVDEKPWYKRKENILIGISVFLVILAFLTPFFIYLRYKGHADYGGLAGLGPVGDFVGGSTMAFLNLASFLMVVAAIIMQKEELSLQRRELKITNTVLERTREEYELTNQTMLKQQFDNTFFNMLKLHNDILEAITISDTYSDFTGKTIVHSFRSREAIEKLYNKLLPIFYHWKTKVQLQRTYEDFYHDHHNLIGHYYRNLYRIVKYVLSSNLNGEDKKFYMGLIRAQLSSYELVMLFYNISYSEAGLKFKEILKGQEFFQSHISPDLFFNPAIDSDILKEIESA